MGPAPPHRLGDLQYLSDNSLQNVLTHYTKVVPPGALSWVRRIHKLAIEWAYYPSLINGVNVSFWFMNEIGPIMGNFNAAQRLYIVLNGRDEDCPLAVPRRPDTVEGSVSGSFLFPRSPRFSFRLVLLPPQYTTSLANADIFRCRMVSYNGGSLSRLTDKQRWPTSTTTAISNAGANFQITINPLV